MVSRFPDRRSSLRQRGGGAFLQGPHIRAPQVCIGPSLKPLQKNPPALLHLGPNQPLWEFKRCYMQTNHELQSNLRHGLLKKEVSPFGCRKNERVAQSQVHLLNFNFVSIQSFGALFFSKAAHVPRDAPLHQSYALLFSPAAREKKITMVYSQTQTKKSDSFLESEKCLH